MRTTIKRLLIMILAAAVTAGACTAATPARIQESKVISVKLDGESRYSAAYEVLDLINEARQNAGLRPLRMDTGLLNCAMKRAAESLVYTNEKHTRPNGKKYRSILDENNIEYGKMGENIAGGYTDAAEAMEAWMSSDAHKKNILSEDFTAIGIGCFVLEDGSTFWTQIFADTLTEEAPQTEDCEIQMTVSVNPNNLGTASLTANKHELAPGRATYVHLRIQNKGWDGASFCPSADSVIFASSAPEIASIDAAGRIAAQKTGTAEITAVLSGTPISAAGVMTVTDSIAVQKAGPVEVSNRSVGIKAEWPVVSGAEQYMLYRSADGGAYRSLVTTRETEFLDKSVENGVKYKYKVYACRNGEKSRPSKYKMIYRLTTPEIKPLEAGSDGTVVVRWNKNSAVSGYELEYTPAGGYAVVINKKQGSAHKKLTGLARGTSYAIRVRSYLTVKGGRRYSGWSETASVTVS